VRQSALPLNGDARPVRYSIDTSVLIDAYRVHYPPQVFPSVWAVLDELADTGVMAAPEEVLCELEVRDDHLLKWSRDHRGMFRPLSETVQKRVTDVLALCPALIDADASGPAAADPYVIALAEVEGCAVVTSEKATGNVAKPRIPDVCKGLGIACLDLVAMLSQEGRVI
jgi:hypothetical protein